MAELLGWDLSRGWLKRVYGRGHNTIYDILAAGSAIDIVSIVDDFTGPVIAAPLWTVGNGAGAGATSPAISVGVNNGVIRMTTGTAGNDTASSSFSGARNFRGDQNAVMIARLAIETAVTGLKVEVGFRNAITTGAAAEVVNVKATPTFTAADGVVWNYDTDDTGRGWEGQGVKASTGATTITTYNVVPVLSTYEYLGVALSDDRAYFLRWNADGRLTYKSLVMAGAVTKTVLLAPHIYIEARNATSKSVDIDMVRVYQGRTTI